MMTLIEADPGFLAAVEMVIDIVNADIRKFGRKIAYDKFCRRNNGWLAEHAASSLLGAEVDLQTRYFITALHYVNLLFHAGKI